MHLSGNKALKAIHKSEYTRCKAYNRKKENILKMFLQVKEFDAENNIKRRGKSIREQ